MCLTVCVVSWLQGLKVIDPQTPDFLRTLELAVQSGTPALLQNVREELDPSLAPILNRAITRVGLSGTRRHIRIQQRQTQPQHLTSDPSSVSSVGDRFLLRLSDREVEYDPDFRLYITTKLPNPHYTPEISTKTTIVNFAVKEQVGDAAFRGCVCLSGSGKVCSIASLLS